MVCSVVGSTGTTISTVYPSVTFPVTIRGLPWPYTVVTVERNVGEVPGTVGVGVQRVKIVAGVALRPGGDGGQCDSEKDVKTVAGTAGIPVIVNGSQQFQKRQPVSSQVTGHKPTLTEP